MRTLKQLREELGVREVADQLPNRDATGPDPHRTAEGEAPEAKKGLPQTPPDLAGETLIKPAGVYDREAVREWMRRTNVVM